MNYEQVIAGYNNGTIDPMLWKLVIDNDDGYWEYLGNYGEFEGSYDDLVEGMDDKYGSPCGYSDIVEVLQAAGVNAEWC